MKTFTNLNRLMILKTALTNLPVKIIITLISLLLSNNLLYSQSTQPVNLDSLHAIISEDRSGKGLGTFSLTLRKLEHPLMNKMRAKELEMEFGDWNSYGGLNNVELEFDDKTNDHSIPLFVLNYDCKTKNIYYSCKIEIERNLSNPIKYFEVTTILNGVQIAQFEESLRANKYLLNENLSEIINKRAYQNPKKKLLITIKRNRNATYTLGIRGNS